MSYTLIVIFSFSIALPAILGWIRFKKMDPAFYPIVLLVTAGSVNELLSFFIIRSHHSNAVNANIYSLLEALLITWQFRNWNLFLNNDRWPLAIASFLVVAWTIVNFFTGSITGFNSYFNIVYGTLMAIMSINMTHRLRDPDYFPYNAKPASLVSACFLLYYTYSAFVEIYWLWGMPARNNYLINIYRILTYVNLMTNLCYVFAFVWIPRKREYIVL